MEITADKVDRYLGITKEALSKIKLGEKKDIEWKAAADDFLDMAQRYHSDAVHFRNKGDMVNAFAAVNYAHAWLDAGARLGLFDVHDSRLFAADE